MMDIFEKFATDENLELEGTDVEIGGGSTVKVARAENSNYLKRITELWDKHRAVLDQEDDEAKSLDKKLINQVIAETVLVGWKKLAYKGKSVKYSVANAIMLLEHNDFKKLVLTESNRFENYRVKAEKADVKN